MVKFSIIVPVYNVEKYIVKCIDSLVSQTFDDIEILVINDGTKDNSIKNLEESFNDKRIKIYNKKNGGLSDARNFGVKYANGEYITFIDSDDYVDKNYFEKINEILLKEKNIDIFKIKMVLVDEKYNIIKKENGLNQGFVTFADLVKLEYFEPACSYIYNKKFWNKNKFSFAKGMFHEDFGLIPEVMMKANRIFYLDYYAYYYVQRENSIMSSVSKEKTKKKVYDCLKQYDRLIKINYDKDSSIYKSFLANGLISKSNDLAKDDKKIFISELRKRKIFDDLLDDSLKRKIKKIIYKIKYRSW